MIDERKLIEEIEKHRLEYKDHDMGIGINVVKELIESQPKVGEWILCIERLPENYGNVIACFCTGTVTELLYKGEGKFRGLYEYPKDVIVAWQPLPEPYKEGLE